MPSMVRMLHVVMLKLASTAFYQLSTVSSLVLAMNRTVNATVLQASVDRIVLYLCVARLLMDNIVHLALISRVAVLKDGQVSIVMSVRPTQPVID